MQKEITQLEMVKIEKALMGGMTIFEASKQFYKDLNTVIRVFNEMHKREWSKKTKMRDDYVEEYALAV